MRNEFFKEKKFEYFASFNIQNNYKQYIKACSIIKDKPNRINMKFETFDRKFSICFVDSAKFEGICKLIYNYYEFRKEIKNNSNRVDTSSFNSQSHSFTQRKLSDDVEIDDESTFILEIFGLYKLTYRWFKTIKLIIFDQISHFRI